MKPIRSIFLTAILVMVVFSAVTYTACHKDKCHNVICLNKGVCDAGKCICLQGYEGPRCDTLNRVKFIFTFNGADICGATKKYNQYPLKFTVIPLKPLEMKMKNILNNPYDSATCTMQAADSFSFIGANNSTTYSGYGTLKHDTLRLSYHVRQDTTSYDCKYQGSNK